MEAFKEFPTSCTLKPIDTRNNEVQLKKPDITLVPRVFGFENIFNICLSDGLVFINQGFIEVKKGNLHEPEIGQIFSYLHRSHQKVKHRKIFIGALTNFKTIIFVKSDFSNFGMVNEITPTFPLFDNTSTNDKCKSIGLQYLYSMMMYGIQEEEGKIPIPNIGPLKFKKFLGRGATSNVYEVSIQNRSYALKLCNSIHNIRFMQYEISILEQLRDLPNIPTVINSDTNSIIFPLYRSLKQTNQYEILNKDNMLALVNLLKKVHERNIYHRDLRPDNILLDNNENVILIDWGYAVGMNPTSNFAGTASFCAEKFAISWLLSNDSTYNPRYDCESLLKCFYYLKDGTIRFELDLIAKHDQNERLKSAIEIWRSVKDESFTNCLNEIRNGDDMYGALQNYIEMDQMEY